VAGNQCHEIGQVNLGNPIDSIDKNVMSDIARLLLLNIVLIHPEIENVKCISH